MSIAQVLNVSGGPQADATPPEEAAKMTEATKALDGCVHIYMLGNSQTGEGMVVIAWRDEAAMKAAADHIAADNDTLKDLLAVSIKPGPVYDIFTEL
jgi:quinol monooxygenase YgiN